MTADGCCLLAMLHHVATLPTQDAIGEYCAKTIATLPGVVAVQLQFGQTIPHARQESDGTWLLPIQRGELGHGLCRLRVVEGSDGLLTDIRNALSLIAIELENRRQRQELAARTSDAMAQFALLANHTTDMFIVTDADDRIEWVNPAFTSETGYTLQEVLGRYPRDLLQGKETNAEASAALAAAIREHRAIDIEMVNYKRGGRPYWAEISVRPVPALDGRGVKFVSVQRDATERRRTRQALLEARDAAQAADTAKTKFVAMMSHELRTPLNAIKGFSELGHDMAAGNPPLQEYLGYIISAADNLTRLINNILDFARLGSGFTLLESATASPLEIARSVLRELKAVSEAKGLRLEFVPPDDGQPIVIDAGKLRQIMQNLVGNGIKYTETGYVRLTLAYEASEQAERPYLIVRVEDSGIGIAARDQAAIFEPFFQAESGHARRHEGSGLGLAIVRQLVETMAGAISMQSVPGVGSVFTVRLPVLLASRTESAEEPSSLPALQGQALVVDDNRLNVMLLQNMLERLGMQVCPASSGFEALSHAATTPFNIIFMDLQMPEMDGFETMRRLRQGDGPNARTPMIAVSAHVSALHHQQAVDSGADAFLPKPFTRDALSGALAGCLDGYAPI